MPETQTGAMPATKVWPSHEGSDVKTRKSRKAPAIKTAVIVQRAQGKPKSHIARDLHIAHNTVSRIIEESDVDRQLESSRQVSVGLIPDAIRVAKHRLSQNSENMAIKVLENTIWPLNAKSGRQQEPGLVLAIQNLMGNVVLPQTQEKPLELPQSANMSHSSATEAAIEVKPTEAK